MAMGDKNMERIISAISAVGYGFLGAFLRGWGVLIGLGAEVGGFFLDNDFLFNFGRDTFLGSFSAMLIGMGAGTDFSGYWVLFDTQKTITEKLSELGIYIPTSIMTWE